MSSIYVGMQLLSPIINQKRYDYVINEVLQYLQINTEAVYVR